MLEVQDSRGSRASPGSENDRWPRMSDVQLQKVSPWPLPTLTKIFEYQGFNSLCFEGALKKPYGSVGRPLLLC